MFTRFKIAVTKVDFHNHEPRRTPSPRKMERDKEHSDDEKDSEGKVKKKKVENLKKWIGIELDLIYRLHLSS